MVDRRLGGPTRRARPRRDRDRGPHAVEQQRHVPGQPDVRRGHRPGDLQTDTWRAAAVGLRAGPAPPRAGRLPPQRGDGHRPRAADGDPRRSARGGLAAVVRRRRPQPALLHDPRGARRPPRHPAWRRRVRPDRQQHRPQERSRADRHRRPRLGHRPRAVLRRRLQAAHRRVGVRRRDDHRRAGARAARLATAVPLEIAALLADDEVEAVRERACWIVEHPTFPIDSSGRRYPWPLV